MTCIYNLFREVEPIREGKEPRTFWEAIGGYEEYATGKRIEVTVYRTNILVCNSGLVSAATALTKINHPIFLLFFFQEEKPSYPPRLFQCSNASGAFRVEEIFEFCQEVIIKGLFILSGIPSICFLHYSGVLLFLVGPC